MTAKVCMAKRNLTPYVLTSQKILNSQEIDHLKAVAERFISRGTIEARNCILILMALECGLRASELLGLKFKHFDFTKWTVFVESLKRSNPRTLPLTRTRIFQIKELFLRTNEVSSLHEIDPEALLFNMSYPRLWQVWSSFRPHKRKNFHTLRHTFALDLYLKCRDLKAVQLALGHRSITNTMIYLDFAYSEDVLRKYMHGKG